MFLNLCRHAFGFSGEKGKGCQLACVDNDTIVYPIGCKLAIYKWVLKHMFLNHIAGLLILLKLIASALVVLIFPCGTNFGCLILCLLM